MATLMRRFYVDVGKSSFRNKFFGGKSIEFDEPTLRVPLNRNTNIGRPANDSEIDLTSGDLLFNERNESDRHYGVRQSFEARPSYDGSKIVIPPYEETVQLTISRRQGSLHYDLDQDVFYYQQDSNHFQTLVWDNDNQKILGSAWKPGQKITLDFLARKVPGDPYPIISERFLLFGGETGDDRIAERFHHIAKPDYLKVSMESW